MKTNPILYTVILAGTLLITACGKHSENDGHDHSKEHTEAEAHAADEIGFTKEQAAAAGLETEKVTPAPFTQVIKTSGQILAGQGDEVMVVATSNGIVSYTNAALSDGSAVRSGEAIFSISGKSLIDGDPTDKARREFETIRKEYERAENLAKDQIISAKEFEQIRLRYENAEAALKGISARSNGSGVTVTAPIGGFIKNRLVQQGQYVSVGQPVAVIAQTKRLQLRAEVSERYFDQLPAIVGANFKLPYSNRLFKLSELNGQLLSFGKTANENAFYVPVTFGFDNVGSIVAGSYAEIYLLAAPRNQVISVPVAALTEEQGLHFVYLRLDEEGFRKQEVTPGQTNGDRTEITSGLKAGDEVVIKGTYQVKLAANSAVVPEGHSH